MGKIFKQYRRTQKAEMRPVDEEDIEQYLLRGFIVSHETENSATLISISNVDSINGSPKIGDMIARNPIDHLDQWLVAEKYFKDNFEEI